MIGRIWAIALNTFREAARIRVLYGILVLVIGANLLALVLGQMSIRDEARVARDIGLAGISLFGSLTAIFLGVFLLYSEVQRRTIHGIVAKPIERWEFVVGKYLGMGLVLSLLVGLFAAAMAAQLAFQGVDITSAVLNVFVTTPNTQVLGDNEICLGDTTQLSNMGNVSHLWSPSNGVSDPTNGAPLFFPTVTTTYSLTVTDAAGCIGTDSVVVTVNALPSVDAGPAAGVCVGASTPIGGTPTGPTGSTYQWSPAAGLNNAAAANPVAQPANTSTYTVFVTDVNQCSAMDSVTVTVNPLPLLEAGNDTSFCQGGSVQLNATGIGTFLWSPSTGLNTVDVPNPIASPAVTTSYSVSLTDANNCTATAPDSLRR